MANFYRMTVREYFLQSISKVDEVGSYVGSSPGRFSHDYDHYYGLFERSWNRE